MTARPYHEEAPADEALTESLDALLEGAPLPERTVPVPGTTMRVRLRAMSNEQFQALLDDSVIDGNVADKDAKDAEAKLWREKVIALCWIDSKGERVVVGKERWLKLRRLPIPVTKALYDECADLSGIVRTSEERQRAKNGSEPDPSTAPS